MTKPFKPMLASPANLDTVRYPIFASPKLDGIRASVMGGKLLSRTLKEIPSKFIFDIFSHPEYEGLDGELIVGDPTSPTCYRDTVSGVMAHDKSPIFTYWVFDLWNKPYWSFTSRRRQLVDQVYALSDCRRMRQVRHELIHDRQELDAYEQEKITEGYEGIMLADPNATYKFGRATAKGGELLKVKRFVDAEAEIIGFEEEMFNGNEAQTNELGRTKRSTAAAGLVPKSTMGALVVRCRNTGVEFNIGTGFTAEDRQSFWDMRETHVKFKTVVKFKSFPIGVKDKPRHPVFLGIRPPGA